MLFHQQKYTLERESGLRSLSTTVASGQLLARLNWFVTVERRLRDCSAEEERRRCNLKPKYDLTASPESPSSPSFSSPLDCFPFSFPFP